MWFLGLFAIVRLWNKLENQVATIVSVSGLKVLRRIRFTRDPVLPLYPYMVLQWTDDAANLVGCWCHVWRFGAVCRHPASRMVISSWNLALKARWTCTAYLEPNVDAPKELLLVSQTCEADGRSVFAQIKCGARVHAGASVRLNLEGNDAQSTMETNHPSCRTTKKDGVELCGGSASIRTVEPRTTRTEHGVVHRVLG